MRLNGKRAIMQHLGKAKANQRAWYAICLRYGHLIRLRSPQGKMNRGYWALSEEIDAFDKAECPTILESELNKLQREVTAYQKDVARVPAYRPVQRMRDLVTA